MVGGLHGELHSQRLAARRPLARHRRKHPVGGGARLQPPRFLISQ
jgi:hypothetical protein